jgi:chitodextrinase
VFSAAKHTALAATSLVLVLSLASIGSARADRPAGPRDNEKPSPPTNVRVVSATPTSVGLTWDVSTDNVGIGGYYISVDKRRDVVEQVDVPLYTAADLQCGQSVTVWIVAFDLSGNKSERAVGTVSTAACPDTQPPTPPTGFRQDATTQSEIVLGWSPSSDNVGVVGYGIYRQGLPVGSTSTVATTLSGLGCGSTYEYAVDAYDGAGNRSPRGSVWVKTAACSGDSQAPSAPTNLRATSGTTTTIAVAWSASNDNVGVTGYDLYRGSSKVGSVDGTSYTFAGLACGTSHTLGVEARDAAGNRSTRATIAHSTTACSASPPPSDSTAPTKPSTPAVSSSSATSVSLTWGASTDNVAVIGYGVYLNGSRVLTVSQLSTTVSGLACGLAYTFGVDAYDAAGNRSARAETTTTTSACADSQAPTAPFNVAAISRTDTSIALTWSPSTDNVGVVGYGLYRGGTLVGTSQTPIGVFAGLTCNQNYTLAVDAYDAAGNRSSKITTMVATTACVDTAAPSTPTGLSASNVSQTGLTLGWNASTDNVGVTGYDVYRNGAKVVSVTGTTTGQSGLACGTTYTFSVRARDVAGNVSQPAQLGAATAACSQPPSVSYPASYYTGPLGSRNLLPSKAGAFLIDMWGGIGTTTSQFQAAIASRESFIGRSFDGIHVHYGGGGSYLGISNCVAPDRIAERLPQWIHSRGSMALVSWAPDRSIADVNSGAVDQCFRNVADHLKSFNFPIMLRMWWEFNLPSPPWSGCGQPFIDAWRRVVNIFKAQGATNVGFWWVPYEHADHACADSSYPGDQYVDWVGSDAYNFHFVGENGWSTPLHAGWAEFWEIADHTAYPTFHNKYGARKPFVFGEMGTVYDPNAPATQKGNWFRDIPIVARNMEYLRGISFYDADVSAVEGARNNFRVDYSTSNPDVYNGFKQMATDPWMNAR